MKFTVVPTVTLSLIGLHNQMRAQTRNRDRKRDHVTDERLLSDSHLGGGVRGKSGVELELNIVDTDGAGQQTHADHVRGGSPGENRIDRNRRRIRWNRPERRDPYRYPADW